MVLSSDSRASRSGNKEGRCDCNEGTAADEIGKREPKYEQTHQVSSGKDDKRNDAKDENLLAKFEENDTLNPRNYSKSFKAWITLQFGCMTLAGSFGSSIIASAEPYIASEFNVSEEVTVLVISLYIVGFALGPCLWGPVSEVYGRKWSMIPAVVLLGVFSIGSAVSMNAQSIFITRFFGGIFGSAPLSNVSAALGDIYEPRARGMAVTFYTLMVIGGSSVGPIIGSALISDKSLGWRWTEYITAIIAFAAAALNFFALPETFAPVILKRKAKRLRKEVNDNRHWHPQELERIKLNNVATKYLSRPLRMLITEPVIFCTTIYASYVYGLLYMMLEIIPFVYSDLRGWGVVVAWVPFTVLLVGVIFALSINLLNQAHYQRAIAKSKTSSAPEARLPPMLVAGFLFTIGLFWFGWTADPKYHWAVPTVAIGFIGAGFITIYQQCLNYLVDVYGPYAASAVAAQVVVRSLFACGMPLAALPMLNALDVGPACSILGGLSCLGLPVPFLFMKYGSRLREMSKFAPVPKTK